MKRLIIFAVLIFGTLAASAQVKITGVVRDTKGEPVIGAAVMLDGRTDVGTVTDVDGKYSLTIPQTKDAVLTASSISYKSESLPVGKGNILNFTLKEDAELLEEVVVVGYGMMRKSDLTGSVTSVRIDEDEAARANSLDKLLQGHAAGVQISAGSGTDSGVNIRIRGTSTLTGSSEPLYVVDGVIMSTTSKVSMMSVNGTDMEGNDEETNPLMSINPQDIASIEILKDASATAIYGSEGSNGVVLITTKTANKEIPVFTFTAGVDVATTPKHLDVLSFDEYLDFVDEAYAHSGSVTVNPDTYGYSDASILSTRNRIFEDPATRTGLKVTPVDWQDYSYREAVSQRYFFSVSGRPNSLSYNFSIGYSNNQGLIENTSTERYTIRLNLRKYFGKKATVGTRFSLAYIDSEMMQGSSGYKQTASTGIIRSLVTSRPFISGNLAISDDGNVDWSAEDELDKNTPKKWFEQSSNIRKDFDITPNLFFQYKFTPWLTYEVSAGANYTYSDRTKFRSAALTTSGGLGATTQTVYAESNRWNVDNLLMFNKKFKQKHNLSGTLGVTFSSRNTMNQSLLSYNMTEGALKADGINSALSTGFRYDETRINMLSYFVRAIYNYDDRYVITGTYRVDGSCKFQGKNVFSSFPSFAAAWRISEEPWFHVPVISALKLRLGWGQVGNSAVSSYRTLAIYSPDRIGSNNPSSDAGYDLGVHLSNIPNTLLKWETTEQWNAGLDVNLWKGRLSFTADAYYKYTFDLLNQKYISYTSGVNRIWVNQGAISNKGLEFSFEGVPVKTDGWEVRLNGNISFNRNRIEDIGTDSSGDYVYMTPTPDGRKNCRYYYGATIGSGNYGVEPVNIFIEGQPVGLLYGYKTDGIIQEGETAPKFEHGNESTYNNGPGGIRLVDPDGDGTVYSTERTILGDPNPDFSYGFGGSVSYKGLTLSANFYGVYGNEIVNQSNMLFYNTNDGTNNVLRKAYLDAWTPDNTDATMPRIRPGQAISNYFIDYYIEDGSFLRLGNVALSYLIKFRKGSILKNMTVGASVNNVYVWTKYSGYDPEVNSYGYDMTRMGVDNGSFPRARTYSFDLKFTF